MAGSTRASVIESRVASPLAQPTSSARVRTEHPLRGFARRFGRNWIGMSGALIVVLCILVAVLAPLLAPYVPEETHPNWKLFALNEFFLFGTDEFGRDILSRV